MRHEATGVPRTIEAVLEQYDKCITGMIHKISRGKLSDEDVKDIKQEIALRAIEKRYFERYDPAKASIETYLFCLIRTVVINNYERQQRDPLYHVIGSVGSGDRSAATQRSEEAVMELFSDLKDDSFERAQIARDLNDRLAARLERLRAAGGGERRADLGRAFRLMREERQTQEIAADMGVTRSCVSKYFRLIRLEAHRFISQSPRAA